jgi:alpha-amylase/alpha-mannosidase (GH57 family)
VSPRYVCIHGHFYQPPRENPWTDEVETETSARPFHDWNERITSECYRANAYARVTDDGGRIEAIVDNYEFIDFNFGPTLLRWLERHHPDLLARIVEADARSLRERGEGNAIAQTYSHMILPLADARDRRTQIRWGLAEFRHRFGRDAQALWLSETAANDEVLGDLIDHGMRFAILAPQQAKRVRESEDDPWQDVSESAIDSSRAYRYLHRDGSGRTLALFFYDGPLASQVSFGGALKSSHGFVDLCLQAAGPASKTPRLVHVAVDGETAGHHFAWGDRALAYALTQEAPQRGLRVRNYAEVLSERPPRWEVEIDLGPEGEGTSWSCAHGVGRWTRDCGCRHDHEGWNQAWRTPLREAFDFLRDASRPWFEAEAAKLLRDPWAARDDYVRLLLSPGASARDSFFAEHGRGSLDRAGRERALALLEMQHHLLLMYTSCGWFFDDIAGIESVQVLQYAARALELWESLASEVPRPDFEAILAKAQSNDHAQGSGLDIFHRRAEAVRVGPERVAAHVAMSAAVAVPPGSGVIGLYRYEQEREELQRREDRVLYTARLRLEHERVSTPHDFAAAMLHAGGSELHALVVPFPGDDAFVALRAELRETVVSALDPHEIFQTMAERGQGRAFGVDDLVETRRGPVLEPLLRRILRPNPEESDTPPCPVDAAEFERWLTGSITTMLELDPAERERRAGDVAGALRLARAMGLAVYLDVVQNVFHEELLPSAPAIGPAMRDLADALGFSPVAVEGRSA